MESIYVGIGEYKTSQGFAVMESHSLGSCVGIAIYDEHTKIAGLAHIMLPSSLQSQPENVKKNPGKFADTALRLMIQDMLKLGAGKSRLRAKIAGGACMFQSAMPDQMMNIGLKNIEAVRTVLAREHVPVVAEDVGKNYGRTVIFYADTGKLAIKSAKYGIIEL